MFNKWQLVLLGVVVFQGAGLNAMEKKDSPRGLKRSSLAGSQEIKVKSELIAAAVKRSVEKHEIENLGVERSKMSSCVMPGYISIERLNLQEGLRKPHLAWLPI